MKKAKSRRVLKQKKGTYLQRCIVFDWINAVYSGAYEVNRKIRHRLTETLQEMTHKHSGRKPDLGRGNDLSQQGQFCLA